MSNKALTTLAFTNAHELRTWLNKYHNNSSGIGIRIFKKTAGMPSVTFAEGLDKGLCFGWSESMRRCYDKASYLQKFTPRKTRETKSACNLATANAPIE